MAQSPAPPRLEKEQWGQCSDDPSRETIAGFREARWDEIAVLRVELPPSAQAVVRSSGCRRRPTQSA
jgi:hypothetical protein